MSRATPSTPDGRRAESRTSGRLASQPSIKFFESDPENESDMAEQLDHGRFAWTPTAATGSPLPVTPKRNHTLLKTPTKGLLTPRFDTPETPCTDQKDGTWEMGGEESADSDEIDWVNSPSVMDEDDELNYISTPARGTRAGGQLSRRAAKTAMRKMQAIAANPYSLTPARTPQRSPIKASTANSDVEPKKLDPMIRTLVRTFDERKYAFLKPLPISRDRLTIDAFNVSFYAEEGATDPWASALSSSRFNGPRRHPPWRELHRLTDPDENDVSDWAENIRWAKMQYRVHGSIWTEYDYSLETITQHRLSTFWASEEIINSISK